MAVEQISPAEAARALADGVRVIDVREPDEWEAGHVGGAEHVPLGALADLLTELAGAERVVFVCRSGARSDVAAAVAERAGVRRADNLAGGMHAWAAAGLPLEPPGGTVI